ncbi:MAG: hypothetical protein C0483_24400 [Pirellula sp.]|nr:hypothetical protein [Pirellula sp.]
MIGATRTAAFNGNSDCDDADDQSVAGVLPRCLNEAIVLPIAFESSSAERFAHFPSGRLSQVKWFVFLRSFDGLKLLRVPRSDLQSHRYR